MLYRMVKYWRRGIARRIHRSVDFIWTGAILEGDDKAAGDSQFF